MKIELNNPPSLDTIKQAIENKFPEFKCSYRTKNILVVKKSSTAAALVNVRANSIIVNESFPTMIGQLIFTFAVLFLGILIPLIIYFATMYKKQKFVRTTVSDFITKEFVNSNKAVNV